MFVKLIRQRKDEILLYLGIEAGVFLVLSIIRAFLVFSGKDASDTDFFALAVVVCGLFVTYLYAAFSYPVYFNMAIGMNAVRKKYIPVYYICSVLAIAIQYAFILILRLIEKVQFEFLYPEMEYGSVDKILFSKYVITAALFLSAVSLLSGALLLRFGKRAFWVIWAVYMVVCLAPAKIGNMVENNPDGRFASVLNKFADLFESFGGGMINGLVLVLAVCCLIAVYFLSRRQAVTEGNVMM
jgi:hypothetical protein